jgi:hypothetical protein
MRNAHALGDDLHPAGDAAENVGQFVGESVTPCYGPQRFLPAGRGEFALD